MDKNRRKSCLRMRIQTLSNHKERAITKYISIKNFCDMQKRKRLKSYNNNFSDRSVIRYVPKPYSVADKYISLVITAQKAN